MEKDRKFRALAIAAICVAIVGVSVAYAALQASLTITGTAAVNATWGLEFVEANTTKTGLATITTAPTTNGTQLTWEGTFGAPGDTIVFTAKIHNVGSIPAKLSSVIPCTITAKNSEDTDLVKFFECTAKYGTNELSTRQNKVLAGGATTTSTVEITAKLKPFTGAETNETLVSLNGKKFEFTTSLTWEQAADNTTTFES